MKKVLLLFVLTTKLSVSQNKQIYKTIKQFILQNLLKTNTMKKLITIISTLICI